MHAKLLMKPYVISKKVATKVRNFLREKNVQQLPLRKNVRL